MERARVVLSDAQDVIGSVGRPGFIAGRLGAGRDAAPEVDVTIVPNTRLDLLVQRLVSKPQPETTDVPPALSEWFTSMFPDPVLDSETVLVVASMSETLETTVWRHRSEGYLVTPPLEPSNEDREWLDSEFEVAPFDVDVMREAVRTLEAVDGARFDVVLFNISTYIPEETNSLKRSGDGEPLSLLANRIDLMTDIVAEDTGVFVLDVDRIVAELGAAESVLSPGRYSEAVHDAIAEEAMELIIDLPTIGEYFSPEVMQLVVPRYDRRTDRGVLLEWHANAPAWVTSGQVVFDVRFENVHWRLNGDQRRKTGRQFDMSVVAMRDGYLEEIVVRPGEPITAGATVGVVKKQPEAGNFDGEHMSRFPVGIKVKKR